jgi:hypothetical protein
MSRFDEIQTQFVVIERAQLARLKTIASQLYREDRLNGDAMRDMGHSLTGVLDSALAFDDTAADTDYVKQLRAHLRELMSLVGNVGAMGRITSNVPDEIDTIIELAEQRMQAIRKEDNL